MKRIAVFPIVIMALALAAAVPPVQAQTAFKIPFKFESGGKKLPAGEYLVAKAADGQIVFRLISSGKETPLPVAGPAAPPDPAVAEPRLVFDETGAFEPSYTEYFTIYVLAEVWLGGSDGYLIHTTKGAHKTQTVKGEEPKKQPSVLFADQDSGVR
jgi:hypothetical protein